MKEKLITIWTKVKKKVIFGFLFVFLSILKGSMKVAKKLNLKKGAAIALSGFAMLLVFGTICAGISSILLLI